MTYHISLGSETRTRGSYLYPHKHQQRVILAAVSSRRIKSEIYSKAGMSKLRRNGQLAGNSGGGGGAAAAALWIPARGVVRPPHLQLCCSPYYHTFLVLVIKMDAGKLCRCYHHPSWLAYTYNPVAPPRQTPQHKRLNASERRPPPPYNTCYGARMLTAAESNPIAGHTFWCENVICSFKKSRVQSSLGTKRLPPDENIYQVFPAGTLVAPTYTE